jgi:peroxiredoxin
LRGYEQAGVVEKVRAAGGEIIAVSSEPQVLAGRATEDWKLNFESVGDPHHEIAGVCRERGWVDLFVNQEFEFIEKSVSRQDVDWKPTHPKGYFQPGVLVLRADGRVLYRWRGVPTHKNMGGATERPTAEYVWSQIAAALEQGDAAVDADLDTDPALDQRGLPWLIFAPLLIANGWFVGGRGFKSTKHVMIAALRLVGFVAAWIAAFAFLPKLLVTLALAGWVAYITPKVRWLGRQFQDVGGTVA